MYECHELKKNECRVAVMGIRLAAHCDVLPQHQSRVGREGSVSFFHFTHVFDKGGGEGERRRGLRRACGGGFRALCALRTAFTPPCTV